MWWGHSREQTQPVDCRCPVRSIDFAIVASLSIENVIPLHVGDVRIPDLNAAHQLAHLSGTMAAVMAFAVVQPGGVHSVRDWCRTAESPVRLEVRRVAPRARQGGGSVHRL